MRDHGLSENARTRTGGGFTAKVSRGNGTFVLRAGKPTYRSIDPEPAARFLPIFFSSFSSSPSFFFPLLSSTLGTCAAAKPKVTAREKHDAVDLLVANHELTSKSS